MNDTREPVEVAPAIELDVQIGRIYIQGDTDTSFAEVVDEFNTQKEDMTDTIESLKRLDYSLREEYEDGGSINGPSFS